MFPSRADRSSGPRRRSRRLNIEALEDRAVPALVLDSFGRGAGDPAYVWYFDVNGDNRVGVVDLVAFARRLGKRR